MRPETIFISELDYLRIRLLIDQSDEEFTELESELERAQILKKEQVTPELVTMNSRVEILNMTDNKKMTLQLVYPEQANLSEHKISILAPLGTALLGLRLHDEIEWLFPDKKLRRLQVTHIDYQPEAHGHWHL